MKKARVMDKWLHDKLLTDGMYSFTRNRVDIILSDWTCCDAEIECKRPDTAIKRFFKSCNDAGYCYISDFESCILESIKNGYWEWHEPENFHYGVESPKNGVWYVYLNVKNSIYRK